MLRNFPRLEVEPLYERVGPLMPLLLSLAHRAERLIARPLRSGGADAKRAWLLVLRDFATYLSPDEDVALLVTGVNEILLLRAFDTEVVRSALQLYLFLASRFRRFFIKDGFRAVLPTLLKLYRAAWHHTPVRAAIERVWYNFFLMYDWTFLMQALSAFSLCDGGWRTASGAPGAALLGAGRSAAAAGSGSGAGRNGASGGGGNGSGRATGVFGGAGGSGGGGGAGGQQRRNNNNVVQHHHRYRPGFSGLLSAARARVPLAPPRAIYPEAFRVMALVDVLSRPPRMDALELDPILPPTVAAEAELASVTTEEVSMLLASIIVYAPGTVRGNEYVRTLRLLIPEFETRGLEPRIWMEKVDALVSALDLPSRGPLSYSAMPVLFSRDILDVVTVFLRAGGLLSSSAFKNIHRLVRGMLTNLIAAHREAVAATDRASDDRDTLGRPAAPDDAGANDAGGRSSDSSGGDASPNNRFLLGNPVSALVRFPEAVWVGEYISVGLGAASGDSARNAMTSLVSKVVKLVFEHLGEWEGGMAILAGLADFVVVHRADFRGDFVRKVLPLVTAALMGPPLPRETTRALVDLMAAIADVSPVSMPHGLYEPSPFDSGPTQYTTPNGGWGPKGGALVKHFLRRTRRLSVPLLVGLGERRGGGSGDAGGGVGVSGSGGGGGRRGGHAGDSAYMYSRPMVRDHFRLNVPEAVLVHHWEALMAWLVPMLWAKNEATYALALVALKIGLLRGHGMAVRSINQIAYVIHDTTNYPPISEAHRTALLRFISFVTLRKGSAFLLLAPFLRPVLLGGGVFASAPLADRLTTFSARPRRSNLASQLGAELDALGPGLDLLEADVY